MIELLLDMDWSLLRQQKLTLIVTLGAEPLQTQRHDDLTGILQVLDALQDLAVSSGLVSRGDVFGEKDVYAA